MRQPWSKYLGVYFVGLLVVMSVGMVMYAPQLFLDEPQITAAVVAETPETVKSPEIPSNTTVENSSG